MLPYQEEIFSTNPSLHNALLSSIDRMPDFRPQETVKRMKEEKQNNWKLIYDELEAINHNPVHMRIPSMINENKDLLRNITKKEMEEFCFCYPGLTWCFLQLDEEEMVAILLFHGCFLKYLPMKKEYVRFLESLDIAQELYSLYPSLWKEEELEKSLINYSCDRSHCFTLVYSNERPSLCSLCKERIGLFLWMAVAFPLWKNKEVQEYVWHSLLYIDDPSLFERFLFLSPSTSDLNYLIEKAIEWKAIHIGKYILERMSENLLRERLPCLFQIAVKLGSRNFVSLFLSRMTSMQKGDDMGYEIALTIENDDPIMLKNLVINHEGLIEFYGIASSHVNYKENFSKPSIMSVFINHLECIGNCFIIALMQNAVENDYIDMIKIVLNKKFSAQLFCLL